MTRSLEHAFESRSGIHICYLDIKSILIEFFPDNKDNYERIGNRDISQILAGTPFFSNSEISRVSGFKSFKRQVEWVSGRIAMKLLIREFVDKSQNFKDIEIISMEGGAPIIAGHAEHSISISHSAGLAVGAVSSIPSIGIDAEMTTQEINMDDIFRVAFTESEISDGRKSRIDFYRIWTLKEAYLKYIKKGFAVPLKKIEIRDDKIFDSGVQADVKHETWIYRDSYLLSSVFSK